MGALRFNPEGPGALQGNLEFRRNGRSGDGDRGAGIADTILVILGGLCTPGQRWKELELSDDGPPGLAGLHEDVQLTLPGFRVRLGSMERGKHYPALDARTRRRSLHRAFGRRLGGDKGGGSRSGGSRGWNDRAGLLLPGPTGAWPPAQPITWMPWPTLSIGRP